MSLPDVSDRVGRVVAALALLAIFGATLVTLRPFLPAILWGGVMAVAVEPLHRKLALRLGGRATLASWITGALLALLILIPAAGLSRAVVAFLPDALNQIERLDAGGEVAPPEALSEVPRIGPKIAQLWNEMFADIGKAAAHFNVEIKSFVAVMLYEAQLFGTFLLEFALGIALAVMFMHNADRIAAVSERFFGRLGGEYGRELADHAVHITRGTVLGVIGAALVQTLLALASYIVAGLPGALMLAGVTFILALAQIGAAPVFIPAAIWLWASDAQGMAIFVLVWGLLVVGTVDNVVRSALVSRNAHVPAVLPFFGALGGLIAWGVVGVFLGPVLLAVAWTLAQKWLEPEDAAPEEPEAKAAPPSAPAG